MSRRPLNLEYSYETVTCNDERRCTGSNYVVGDRPDPEGRRGTKGNAPPAAKEGAPTDKDSPKSGERKEPADKKGAQDKSGSKDAGKEASDKESHFSPTRSLLPTRRRLLARRGQRLTRTKVRSQTKDAVSKDGKGGSGSGSGSLTRTRTKVQGSFAKHKRQSVNVNFTVNVGVAVPRSVQLYAIPQDIVVIVPAYRRYRYFVVDNRIIIVDPRTYEIVDIIIIA